MRRRDFINPTEYARRVPRRRLIVLLAGAGILLTLLTTATIGLILGPPSGSPPETPPVAGPGTGSRDRSAEQPEVGLPSIAAISDSEKFARSAAEGVFAWDTRDGYMPRDYIEALVDAGDPESDELNGLAQDLARYLPSTEAWTQLQEYETRQRLDIGRIWVPERWNDVLEQAREGTILPGTLAYTIEGTRHRSGAWDGERSTIEHPVSFTVFVVCAPSYAECRLLRLSGLDTPLI